MGVNRDTLKRVITITLQGTARKELYKQELLLKRDGTVFFQCATLSKGVPFLTYIFQSSLWDHSGLIIFAAGHLSKATVGFTSS